MSERGGVGGRARCVYRVKGVLCSSKGLVVSVYVCISYILSRCAAAEIQC